jgi:hypothetical protein
MIGFLFYDDEISIFLSYYSSLKVQFSWDNPADRWIFAGIGVPFFLWAKLRIILFDTGLPNEL